MATSTTDRASPSPNTSTPATLALVPQHLSDLSLLVGEAPPNQILLHVDTRTLRKHSSFFEAMLRGPWLEARSTGPIALPDDDPAGAELMCRILYHELSAETPSNVELVELTAASDKYDLSKVVRAHVRKWTAELLKKGEDALCPGDLCYIAWTFGFHAHFEVGWKRLVNRSYGFTQGPVRVHSVLEYHDMVSSRYHSRRVWDLELEWLPEGTKEALQAAVEARVHALHKAVQVFVMTIIERGSCDVRRAATEEQCDAMIVGGLVATLRGCGIALHLSQVAVPVPARNDGISVQQLMEDWRGKFTCPTMRTHERCNPRNEWRKCLQEVVDRPVKLTQEQLAHFKRFEG